MLCVVAPVLHVFPLAMLDVSTTFPPWQNVVGPLELTVGAGLLFTVTLTGADAPEQLLEFVTVTEYVPAAFTVIDCVVAPVLHMFPVDELEVRTTLPPWQKVVGPPAVTVVAGLLFTVTVTGADDPEQPFPSTTLTE